MKPASGHRKAGPDFSKDRWNVSHLFRPARLKSALPMQDRAALRSDVHYESSTESNCINSIFFYLVAQDPLRGIEHFRRFGNVAAGGFQRVLNKIAFERGHRRNQRN